MSDFIEEAIHIRANGREVQGLKEAVKGSTGAASLHELIAKVEKKRSDSQKKFDFFNSMKLVEGQLRTLAKSNHSCPLCTSKLPEGSNEMKIFQEKLAEIVDTDFDHAQHKLKAESMDAQIKALKAAVDKKVKAGEVEAKAQMISEDLDELKEKCQNARSEVDDALDKRSRAQDSFDKAEHASEFLRQLDLARLSSLKKKIQSAEDEFAMRDSDEVVHRMQIYVKNAPTLTRLVAQLMHVLTY